MTRGRRDDPEEPGLLALARDGDADAYGRLLNLHQDVALRVAYAITGTRADAEEAVQEAALKAFYALGRFRPGRRFRPWLLTIVANEARNRRRAAGRRARLAVRAADQNVVTVPPTPEAVVLAREARAHLLEAVNDMPERDRLALTCRYLLELSERETAAVLGVPTGTVKSRVSRALARLRQQLSEQAQGNDA